MAALWLFQETEGYSGSDIKLVCREAAMRPVRKIFDALEDHQSGKAGITARVLWEGNLCLKIQLSPAGGALRLFLGALDSCTHSWSSLFTALNSFLLPVFCFGSTLPQMINSLGLGLLFLWHTVMLGWIHCGTI